MIRCTKIGIEPSPICHEICVLASRCDALKAWEREKSKQEGKRRIAALILAGGPEGISLIVPYQGIGILLEGDKDGEPYWLDSFEQECSQVWDVRELSHIVYEGSYAKKRIKELIEEIEEDDHEGTL